MPNDYLPYLTADWTGASGTVYRGACYMIDTPFNPVSAVYIACLPGLSDWQAFYVGETGDLRQRLNTGAKDHAGLQCAIRKGAKWLSIIREANADRRLAIETDLRRGLRPSCNQQSLGSISIFDRF